MRLSTLMLIAGLCAALPAAGAGQRPAPPRPAASSGADEAQLKTLSAKLAKNPKDAKLKKQVALLEFKVGHAMEYDDNLPPRVKYPGALRHFRRALSLDPGLKAAADAKKEIEDIYRGMNRPIPQ